MFALSGWSPIYGNLSFTLCELLHRKKKIPIQRLAKKKTTILSFGEIAKKSKVLENNAKS